LLGGGGDVNNLVLDFFTYGKMLECINYTNIVFISKVQALASMAQFRPISLCNVLYKIVSKVILNRMKSLLPYVISECQSAFVPRRMIIDNVIVSFKMLHYLKNKRGGREAQMAAKLDMRKAYDRVEWDYHRAILLKMGFHERWVMLVMECVTSVTYSVMVNGEQKGYIKPTRGLRQRDPLSPYFFLICAECLSTLFRKAERDSLIQGISICRGGPHVSHLFFTDDSIIFCRVTQSEGAALLDLLLCYENALGQKVNSEKTTLFFSPNTQQVTRVAIMHLFGTNPTTQFAKYLGLSPIIGRAKKKTFNAIKDRVWKRLQGWKEKLLSQAL
jgi:hypothetical protein